MCLWNVYLWMLLSTCRSVSDQDQQKKKKTQWMCVLNVFHNCTGLISNNTHTCVLLWCVLFLIFYDSVEQCTLVYFWMFCAQQRPVLFIGELLNSTMFQCYRRVKAHLCKNVKEAYRYRRRPLTMLCARFVHMKAYRCGQSGAVVMVSSVAA